MLKVINKTINNKHIASTLLLIQNVAFKIWYNKLLCIYMWCVFWKINIFLRKIIYDFISDREPDLSGQGFQFLCEFVLNFKTPYELVINS